MIAVTGATGQLGGRVARGLADRGFSQRLIVRDPERAPQLAGAELAVSPGYHDRAAMTAALRGADTLFFVSGREAADRVEQHLTVVAAAVDAGVRRVVYTSFLAAGPDATFTLGRQHHTTEQSIRASGLAFTFLRDNMYLEMLPAFAAGGVLAGPAGQGRGTFVGRDDVAAVAVEVLTGEGHDGECYDLTGPESISLAEAAELMGVEYVEETVEQAYASREKYGAPDWEVEGWVTSYLSIASGELDVRSDVVPRLTGRPGLTLRQILG